MFCPKCGAQLPDNSQFCSSCGSSIAQAPSAPAAHSAPAGLKLSGVKFDLYTVIKLAIAVLTMLFGILPTWKLSIEMFGFSESKSFSILHSEMFDVNALLGIGKIFMIIAIILFVVSAAAQFVDFNKFVPVKFDIKEKASLAFYLVFAFSLILIFIGSVTEKFCGPAVCWFFAAIFCAAGIVLYFKPDLLEKIIKK